MKTDKLIEYKENIFHKICNFFKKMFSRKKETVQEIVQESFVEETIENTQNKISFNESIRVREDEEQIRLKRLQHLYDNGEIYEEDLSEEDFEKLIMLYRQETERLNADTLKIKMHIKKMLKELKEES